MPRSFQTWVNLTYGAKFNFYVQPGNRPPQWTVDELRKELWGDETKEPVLFRDVWMESETVIVGIVLNVLLAYAQLLGRCSMMKNLSNTTPEWDAWLAANAAA